MERSSESILAAITTGIAQVEGTGTRQKRRHDRPEEFRKRAGTALISASCASSGSQSSASTIGVDASAPTGWSTWADDQENNGDFPAAAAASSGAIAMRRSSASAIRILQDTTALAGSPSSSKARSKPRRLIVKPATAAPQTASPTHATEPMKSLRSSTPQTVSNWPAQPPTLPLQAMPATATAHSTLPRAHDHLDAASTVGLRAHVSGVTEDDLLPRRRAIRAVHHEEEEDDDDDDEQDEIHHSAARRRRQRVLRARGTARADQATTPVAGVSAIEPQSAVMPTRPPHKEPTRDDTAAAAAAAVGWSQDKAGPIDNAFAAAADAFAASASPVAVVSAITSPATTTARLEMLAAELNAVEEDAEEDQALQGSMMFAFPDLTAAASVHAEQSPSLPSSSLVAAGGIVGAVGTVPAADHGSSSSAADASTGRRKRGWDQTEQDTASILASGAVRFRAKGGVARNGSARPEGPAKFLPFKAGTPMHERLEAEARARVAREHVAASALSALQRETTKYKRHVKLSAKLISDLRAALTAKEDEARNTKKALMQLQRQMAMLRATDMAAALAGMSLNQVQHRNDKDRDEDSDSDDAGSGTGAADVMPGAEGGIPRWGTSR